MRPLINDMSSIYLDNKYDFMGYTFNSIRDLSYHHIIKRSEGGQKTFDNGALLVGDTSHPYLHVIESKDYEMYAYINFILKEINNQQRPPTRDQLISIRKILLEFEDKYKDEYTSKGKILIKSSYLDRRIAL